MILINQETLNTLCKNAEASPRLRSNLNFHSGSDDVIQRLLNAVEPGTYICPHRHLDPDKREIFLLLIGRLAVITFKEDGNIDECHILDNKTGNFGVEIPVGTWHTIIALEKNTVAYEFKDGPYIPFTDKDFAPWAPREGNENVASYLQELIKRLNLQP